MSIIFAIYIHAHTQWLWRMTGGQIWLVLMRADKLRQAPPTTGGHIAFSPVSRAGSSPWVGAFRVKLIFTYYINSF